MKKENFINDKPHIRIKQFPDEFNTNKMIEDTILHRDGKCPFCGCSELSMIYDSSNIYYEKRYKGKYRQKPLFKNLFSQKLFWYYFNFKCFKCGAEWESEEFPQGLIQNNDYKFSDKNDLLKSFLCSIVGFLVVGLITNYFLG